MPAATKRLRALAAAEEPSTIPGVIERLQALEAALPEQDGVAWFVRLYLPVTQAVHTASRRRVFHDERFLDRLDVVFANLFFAAFRAAVTRPAETPKAWVPLFEARRRKDVAPLQFALAGMNAHINRDLPVALVTVRAELKLALGDDSPEHADYLAVNPLLARTEAKVKRSFETEALALADAALGKLDDRVAMWDVARARDAAWVQAEALWALRRLPGLSRAYLDTLDRTVGFAGRGLLVPL
jgi:Family of unknown function (DUF5995)